MDANKRELERKRNSLTSVQWRKSIHCLRLFCFRFVSIRGFLPKTSRNPALFGKTFAPLRETIPGPLFFKRSC